VRDLGHGRCGITRPMGSRNQGRLLVAHVVPGLRKGSSRELVWVLCSSFFHTGLVQVIRADLVSYYREGRGTCQGGDLPCGSNDVSNALLAGQAAGP